MSNLPKAKEILKNATNADNELGLLKFITCGSVDDGKSTLIGRLLFDAGQVYEDHLDALDDASKKFGTTGENRDFALLVDGLSAEREQGITIDVAYRYFRTKKRAFIVADTPGHEQYTRNMATGASNCDLAIILIDARKGVLVQTRRHALIVAKMGVKKIVLAINKMDLVGYDKNIFENIKKDFQKYADIFKFDEVQAIPIAAPNGENVAQLAVENMGWYNGPYLLEHLENVTPSKPQALNFRFPVQWVNRPDLNFRGFAGYVSSGVVKIGDIIRVSSSGEKAKVSRIVTQNGDLDVAIAGQTPTICLDKEIDVSRGDVLIAANDPIETQSKFKASIFWMSANKSSEHKEYAFKLGTSFTNAKLKVEKTIDFNDLQEAPNKSLSMNAIGSAQITLSKPVLLDTYSKDRELGAFILIDKITNETVGLGMVEAIVKSENKSNRFDEIAHYLMPHHANPNAALKYLINWRIFAAIAFSALVWIVTKNLGYFALAIVAEFVLRPALQYVHYNLYYNDAKNGEDDNISDGSGI